MCNGLKSYAYILFDIRRGASGSIQIYFGLGLYGWKMFPQLIDVVQQSNYKIFWEILPQRQVNSTGMYEKGLGLPGISLDAVRLSIACYNLPR